MLAVVKPSPLRLWGFLLTVLGGALIAFGSIGNWAAISLGGSAEGAIPTKGIDVWQGKVTLILGALIVSRSSRCGSFVPNAATPWPSRSSWRDSPRSRSGSGHSSR